MVNFFATCQNRVFYRPAWKWPFCHSGGFWWKTLVNLDPNPRFQSKNYKKQFYWPEYDNLGVSRPVCKIHKTWFLYLRTGQGYWLEIFTRVRYCQNKLAGKISAKSDKWLPGNWLFRVKYWPVCKIPTTQVVELKSCIPSRMVNTYHWWKFQVKRSRRTWVPEGVNVYFTDRSVKYQITTWLTFFGHLSILLINLSDWSNFQPNSLSQSP